MIRCAGLSGLRKSLGWVITPFFCGKKKIYMYINFFEVQLLALEWLGCS